MAGWPQHEVFANERGRILCMDSLGYVDERNDVMDVIIGASHGAPCATQLALGARPRGVICHDAGIGKGDGGVAGLKLLDAFHIPGAAVNGKSARISDGRDMYENGVISRANQAAQRLGIVEGMPTREAAMRMLNRNPVGLALAKRQITVHDSPLGRVVALDTVKYADARIAGNVLCMGSHSAASMPRYLEAAGVPLAGVITSDVGRAKEDSGVTGLATLDAIAMPAATVDCRTARVGDAVSTYAEGVISDCNAAARRAGVAIGQTAREAAAAMLRHQAKTKA